MLNIFDDKKAKLYDLKTFTSIQDLIFSSDYAMPKDKRVEPKPVAHDQTTAEQKNALAANSSPGTKSEVKLNGLPKPKSAMKEGSKQVSVMEEQSFFDSGSVGPAAV